MTFNPYQFKKQFPLFSQPENQELIYLDNAATTQKPQCVIDAIVHFYTYNNGNAQRSSHRLARQSTDIINTVREQTKQFLGAKNKEEIVFTQGATASINMIAYGLRSQLKTEDCIVASYGEHHANLLPWQEASKATGCKLSLISPTLEELEHGSILNQKSVKIIAITLASNALGNITDINLLSTIRKHYPNSIIVLDITQWLAHYPIELQALPCDFAVCSSHKFYGPTGLGILYGKQGLLETLEPMMVGGEMVDKVMPEKSTYATGYKGLETGTSPMAAIASLGACLDFWGQQNRHAIAEHETALTLYLHQKIHDISQLYPAITLQTQAKNNIGIATITCSTPYSITDLALWLDEKNIAVRTGEHCTQLLWRNQKPTIKGGTLRLSIAAYNTKEDIELATTAINEYCHLINSTHSPKKPLTFENMDWRNLLKKTSWQQRYKQLIVWGKSLTQQENIREDNYLIKGCESSVWLKHQKIKQDHYFMVDSDSNVVKGLAILILCRIDGKNTDTIEQIDFKHYFSQLGLEKHLSQSRINGFNALYNAIMSAIKNP